MINCGTFAGKYCKNRNSAFKAGFLYFLFTLTSAILFSGCNSLKDPNTPLITSVTPPSPSFDRTPTVSGTADADVEITLYSADGCSGSFLGRSRSDSSGRFAVTAQALTEGSYSFSVKATDGDGRSACSVAAIIYALDISGPIITLSAPSTSLISLSSPSVNFSAVYSGVVTVNLTSTEIVLNTAGTATCSSKVITNGTTLNPTISLSNCSGNGSVSFTISYGTAYDDVGNSTQVTSGTFLVDNTGIASAVINPASAVVGSIPTSATVTYSKPVDASSVSAADFTVSGTCTPLPTLSVTSTVGATTTLALTATSCAAVGETVTVSVNLTGIQDPAGSSGTGSVAATYTLDNLGPTGAVFLPATDFVASLPATVMITYNEGITPASVSNADFSISGTCTSLPTFNVTSVTTTDATLTLMGGTCTTTQTAVITADFTGVADLSGNFGSANSSVTYTFDTVGPVALSMSPTSISSSTIPTAATINFDAAVFAASVSASDLVISGTCTTLPVAGLLSVSGNTLNFSLSNNATCAHGQTIILSLNGNAITDSVSNLGSGSVSSTLTYDIVGPTANSLSPSSGSVNAIPSTVTTSFDDAVNAGSVAASDLVISGTCSVLPSVTLSGVAGSLITFTLAGASCTHGQTTIASINGSSISDSANNVGSGSVSATYTVDTTGPVPSSLAPLSTLRQTMPSSLTVTFDDSVAATSVAASDIAVSGTCGTLPTASVASVSGGTVIFNLSTATCAHAQTLQLTVLGSNFTDLLGNAGSNSQSVTFTADLVPASVVSFNPATSSVLAVPFTVAINFSEALDAASVSAADFSVSGTCSTPPTASVNSIAGATVTVAFSGAACGHGQFILLSVNNAGISDSVGNFGTGTTSVTYTLDNLGPTISSFNPASGAPPLSIDITFNESIDPSTVDASDFTIAGSCLVQPTVTAVSTTGNIVTLTLSAATCASLETLQIGVNANLVTDLLGNVGSGSSTVTYTQP